MALVKRVIVDDWGEVHEQQMVFVLVGEGKPAAEPGELQLHGVEHDAQTEDVCSAVEGLVPEDLRREVADRAVDVFLLLRLSPVVREAEVDERQVIGAVVELEDDILHLEVAVHDVDLLEVRQRGEDPADDLERLSVVEDQVRRLQPSAQLACVSRANLRGSSRR